MASFRKNVRKILHKFHLRKATPTTRKLSSTNSLSNDEKAATARRRLPPLPPAFHDNSSHHHPVNTNSTTALPSLPSDRSVDQNGFATEMPRGSQNLDGSASHPPVANGGDPKFRDILLERNDKLRNDNDGSGDGSSLGVQEVRHLRKSRITSLALSNADTIASSEYDMSTVQPLDATPRPADVGEVKESIAPPLGMPSGAGRPNLSHLASFANGYTQSTTDRHVKTNPPIVNTTIAPEKNVVVTEEITTDHHLHHVHPVIQPVVVREELPPKHYLANEETGELTEISPDEAGNFGEPLWKGEVVVAENVSEELQRLRRRS